MAVAGNKHDMYEYEDVPEDEVKAFAKQHGAIFQTTSAKASEGIDDLFKMIGERVTNPTDDKKNIKLGKKETKKKSCC